jgi:hypothetical protein
MKSSVVAITSFYTGDDEEQITILGAGFFYHKGYIITAAQNVVRFDAESPITEYTVVDRILVEVFGINGKDQNSFIYEAVILGIDPVSNIAVLYLNPVSQWNLELPTIDDAHHEQDCLGDSRALCPGSNVYLMGPRADNFRGIFKMTVNDPKWNDPSGRVIVEGVLLNFHGRDASFLAGTPIFDSCGKVIGVFVDSAPDSGPDPWFGIASHFFKPVITDIIAGVASPCGNKVNGVTTTNGTTLAVYSPGFIGVSYHTFSASDEFTTYASNGTRTFLFGNALDESNGLGGKATKKVEGIRVTSIYNGGSLNGIVSPGDIIVKAKGHHCTSEYLGSLHNQYLLSNFTWRQSPGDTIKITYRKQSDNFAKKYKATVTLVAFPIAYAAPYPYLGVAANDYFV